MIICIQGGGEFADECREMDQYFLSLIPDLEITIFAGASEHERAAEITSGNAIAYFASLGRSAHRITDVRDAQVLVLPGGSPRLLLEALLPHRDFLAGLPAIWGASAGAMVLASEIYLPDRRVSLPGLRFIPGRVRPHASQQELAAPIPGVWALAEREGVVASLAEMNGESEPRELLRQFKNA
ncbi:MAG: hypothetical protein WCI25_02175 [Actinomycetes bacterium]